MEEFQRWFRGLGTDYSIYELKNLQRLVLYDNQLQLLLESLCDLSNLQKLYLNRNQLQLLPESLCDLSGLQQLYLERNLLRSLSASVGKLKNVNRGIISILKIMSSKVKI